MGWFIRRLLSILQVYRLLDEGEFSRHDQRQANIMRILQIPQVDHKRRRVIVHLYGDLYAAVYYVTNSKRYLRFATGALLGSSLIKPSIMLNLGDIYPEIRSANHIAMESIMNTVYHIDDFLARVEAAAAVDCTLMQQYHSLSVKFTEEHFQVFANREQYISVRLENSWK